MGEGELAAARSPRPSGLPGFGRAGVTRVPGFRPRSPRKPVEASLGPPRSWSACAASVGSGVAPYPGAWLCRLPWGDSRARRTGRPPPLNRPQGSVWAASGFLLNLTALICCPVLSRVKLLGNKGNAIESQKVVRNPFGFHSP